MFEHMMKTDFIYCITCEAQLGEVGMSIGDRNGLHLMLRGREVDVDVTVKVGLSAAEM